MNLNCLVKGAIIVAKNCKVNNEKTYYSLGISQPNVSTGEINVSADLYAFVKDDMLYKPVDLVVAYVETQKSNFLVIKDIQVSK